MTSRSLDIPVLPKKEAKSIFFLFSKIWEYDLIKSNAHISMTRNDTIIQTFCFH